MSIFWLFLDNKHGIPKGKETVVVFNGLVVGGKDVIFARKRGNKHEEG